MFRLAYFVLICLGIGKEKSLLYILSDKNQLATENIFQMFLLYEVMCFVVAHVVFL